MHESKLMGDVLEVEDDPHPPGSGAAEVGIEDQLIRLSFVVIHCGLYCKIYLGNTTNGNYRWA
jgi:hypothetical protein